MASETDITLYIDADACPVKAEALKVAARHAVPVVIVSNGGLRPSRDPMIRHVVVPKTPDAADDWIADHAQTADIVITADILLAARCVERSVRVVGPDGRSFTPDSIGMAVAMRNLKQQLREAEVISGHNPGFSKADRSRFLGELDRVIRQAKTR